MIKLYHRIKDRLHNYDLSLLFFLLLISQEKIILKLAAIAFIFIMRFNLRLRFRENQLPVFYILIPAIEIVKYTVMGSFYLGNWATLIVSSIYWAIAFFALYQIKNAVERSPISRIENSIKIFSLINFAVCLYQLIQVMLLVESVNPYANYVEAPDLRFPQIIFPYGQSSGDQIRGVFFDNHQNSIIAQFCFIFFLHSRKYLMSLINFFVVLVVCFNTVTLLTLLILCIWLFVTRVRATRLVICGIGICSVLFYVCLTPENIGYLHKMMSKSASSLQTSEGGMVLEKQPIRTKLNNGTDPLNSGMPNSTSIVKIDTTYNLEEISGKRIAYLQTFSFLKEHPLYFLMGSGAGSFSSKLAANFSGVYGDASLINKHLPKPDYETYFKYHGSINRYLTSLQIGKHSINNFPNSVYNQLFTEYGLIGVGVFLFFYLLFFLLRAKHLRYGLILLPLLLIYFNYGYYFETIDIMLFFELLMFMDIKKNTQPIGV